jgi:hypothetical protein
VSSGCSSIAVAYRGGTPIFKLQTAPIWFIAGGRGQFFFALGDCTWKCNHEAFESPGNDGAKSLRAFVCAREEQLLTIRLTAHLRALTNKSLRGQTSANKAFARAVLAKSASLVREIRDHAPALFFGKQGPIATNTVYAMRQRSEIRDCAMEVFARKVCFVRIYES